MAIREITFPSANGRDTIKAWCYTPLQTPRAIVQLVHGFGEHSRRYLHMIDKFQEAGFVVYADDHIGHGKTAFDAGNMGDPGTQGVDGYLTYLKDEKSLHDIAAADYPGLPYFMFGHSWGSMLARGYAGLYGKDLTALMLCGVVAQLPGCDGLADDPTFKELISSGKGGESGLMWMAQAFAGMTDRFPNPATPNDWIALDPRVVADHAADPFNCFNPTAQLMYDLAAQYKENMAGDWVKGLPDGLPVYLLAGDMDPCANYGEGLYFVANQLAKAGHPTTVRAYTGWRHEIHNERPIRDEVEAGLVEFINSVLG